jgi:hypothetical protein
VAERDTPPLTPLGSAIDVDLQIVYVSLRKTQKRGKYIFMSIYVNSP